VTIASVDVPGGAYERRVSSDDIARHNSDFAPRRETDIESWPDNCESFFLSDGRSPVDLPDNWAEARIAFGEICKNEELSSRARCDSAETLFFEGLPSDSRSTFSMDDSLCTRLMEFVHDNDASFGSAAPARRTKSWGYVGYDTASGRLSSRYPSGFKREKYGYSGRSNIKVGAEVPIAVGAGLYGSYQFSRYRTYKGYDKDQSCESSWLSSAPATCGEKVVLQEAAYRDDIAEASFNPDDFQYPLHLHISDVNGEDYLPDRICPPKGTDIDVDKWTAPHNSDLFFTLVVLESKFNPLAHPFFMVFFLSLCACCVGGGVAGYKGATAGPPAAE